MPCYRIHYISSDGQDVKKENRIFELKDADCDLLNLQTGSGELYLSLTDSVVYACDVLPEDAVGQMHTLLPDKVVYVISAQRVQ